jgi:hypothetical protein
MVLLGSFALAQQVGLAGSFPSTVALTLLPETPAAPKVHTVALAQLSLAGACEKAVVTENQVNSNKEAKNFEVLFFV